MIDNNNLNTLILIALVCVFVYYAFLNEKEGFDDCQPITYPEPNCQNEMIEKKLDTLSDKVVTADVDGEVYPELECDSCPIRKADYDTFDYVSKTLLGNKPQCPKKPKSIRQFHDEFFKFRDYTNDNSSMRVDAVDKVQDLYLSGNLDKARNHPNLKIKDLFDHITCGPNLYERTCVRTQKFDNINHEGYRMNYGSPGTHMTRDHWVYNDEKILNGGPVSESLYPNDLEANPHLPVFKM